MRTTGGAATRVCPCLSTVDVCTPVGWLAEWVNWPQGLGNTGPAAAEALAVTPASGGCGAEQGDESCSPAGCCTPGPRREGQVELLISCGEPCLLPAPIPPCGGATRSAGAATPPWLHGGIVQLPELLSEPSAAPFGIDGFPGPRRRNTGGLDSRSTSRKRLFAWDARRSHSSPPSRLPRSRSMMRLLSKRMPWTTSSKLVTRSLRPPPRSSASSFLS
mmetsp:Transcript_35210/g.105264  ORF Transcript_35210/g.105264 Transcript_35210/m.105264 type:complete len:218 (-) Transcript_35210:30-683(-)